ncbi:MAG: alpha/beta hydrolase [Amphiplicatus sp.]
MISEAAKETIAALAMNRAILSQTPVSLAQRRASFEARAALAPAPDDVNVESVVIAGVACDLLTPPGSDDAPFLLYLHGGAYCIGSPRSHRELAGRISRAAGLRAVLPDYRLAPEHPFPAALEDALAVYDAMPGLFGDIAAVAGDSAGGGLALALLVAARDRGSRLPASAALISPWTDLTLSGVSIAERAALDPFLSPQGLEQSAVSYAGAARRDDPLMSPLFATLYGLPPLLIEVGSHEILLDDSARLAARAKAAGVESDLVIADGLFHVYHGFPALPEAREGTARIGAFLARFL